MKKIISFVVIILAVVLAGFLLFKYGNTPPSEIPQLGEAVELQPATHISEGAAHDPYNSNPPTSGPHYAQAANWGIYKEPLADEQLIHNLEHGGIWISYKDVDQDTLSKLTDIANRNYGSVILTPRLQNDSKITLASWGRLQKLDSFDEKTILDFIEANKNKSPEKLAH